MDKSEVDSTQAVIVGRIAGTHGMSGSVRVDVMSDVPHRFDVGESLFICGQSYRVRSSATTPRDQVIVKFKGVDDLATARNLLGEVVSVSQESVPSLQDGEYYYFQLLGLRVFTEDGEDLGIVKEILETGSNDVYVVTSDSGDLLIPALADVILEVRLDEGVMVVHLFEGLR